MIQMIHNIQPFETKRVIGVCVRHYDRTFRQLPEI